MSIIVIFIVICIVIGQINWMLESIVDFIKENAYLMLSVIAVAISFFLQGPIFAGTLAVGLIVLRIILRTLRSIARKVDTWLRDKHYHSLWRWLEEHCVEKGVTSADAIINGVGNEKLPSRFQEYSYPKGSTYKSIITSFLDDCQDKLYKVIKIKLFDRVQEAGMIDKDTVIKDISNVSDRITRLQKIPELCEKVIKELEQEKAIDRLVATKGVLRCRTSTSSTNSNVDRRWKYGKSN